MIVMETSTNTSHVDLQEDNTTSNHHSTTISSLSSGADAQPFDSLTVALEGHKTSNLSNTEIVGVSHKRKESSVSGSSVELVDLEAGVHKTKLHLSKRERDCRNCHMTLDSSYQESGQPIELGCYCKDDLAAAHKQCAETWFKIKGNRSCEICGSIAQNVSCANETELLDQWNDHVALPTMPLAETRMKLLARPSYPKLLTRLYGVCVCHIMALSFQCTFLSC